MLLPRQMSCPCRIRFRLLFACPIPEMFLEQTCRVSQGQQHQTKCQHVKSVYYECGSISQCAFLFTANRPQEHKQKALAIGPKIAASEPPHNNSPAPHREATTPRIVGKAQRRPWGTHCRSPAPCVQTRLRIRRRKPKIESGITTISSRPPRGNKHREDQAIKESRAAATNKEKEEAHSTAGRWPG